MRVSSLGVCTVTQGELPDEGQVRVLHVASPQDHSDVELRVSAHICASCVAGTTSLCRTCTELQGAKTCIMALASVPPRGAVGSSGPRFVAAERSGAQPMQAAFPEGAVMWVPERAIPPSPFTTPAPVVYATRRDLLFTFVLRKIMSTLNPDVVQEFRMHPKDISIISTLLDQTSAPEPTGANGMTLFTEQMKLEVREQMRALREHLGARALSLQVLREVFRRMHNVARTLIIFFNRIDTESMSRLTTPSNMINMNWSEFKWEFIASMLAESLCAELLCDPEAIGSRRVKHARTDTGERDAAAGGGEHGRHVSPDDIAGAQRNVVRQACAEFHNFVAMTRSDPSMLSSPLHRETRDRMRSELACAVQLSWFLGSVSYMLRSRKTTASIVTAVNVDPKLFFPNWNWYFNCREHRQFYSDLEAGLASGALEQFSEMGASMRGMGVQEYAMRADEMLSFVQSTCDIARMNESTTHKLLKAVTGGLVVNCKDDLLAHVAHIAREVLAAASATSEGAMTLSEEHGATLATLYNLLFTTQQMHGEGAGSGGNLLQGLATSFRILIETLGQSMMERRRSWTAVTATATSEKTMSASAQERAADDAFLESFFQIMELTEHIHTNLYGGNVMLGKVRADALMSIANTTFATNMSVALLTPALVDRVMRGTATGAGNAKLDATQTQRLLDLAIKVFAMTRDKDMFVENHRVMMATRILGDSSKSADDERMFVGQLRACSDMSLTSKLTGMLSDVAVREEHNERFQNYLENPANPDARPAEMGEMKLKMFMLTVGHWPAGPKVSVTPVHGEVRAAMAAFETFFHRESSKRRLTWMFSAGTIEVSLRMRPGAPPITATLVPVQALVLLAFSESRGRLSIADVVERSGVQDEDDVVKKCLHSLCTNPSFRLLNRSSNDRVIRPQDTFWFNRSFTTRLRAFRVPMASLETRTAEATVEENRKFIVDASIVRIMKSRRTLRIQELSSGVMTQLQSRFTADPRLIKSRVEALIEQEYMRRDDVDMNTLHYIA